MQYRPVHWIEGMFLRPQHLQAADRYWNELIATSQRCDHAYNYGLRVIELSDEALGNSQVQVTRCLARTRDGSVIDIESGQEPDRVDLKPAFENASDVTVYLAVPKLKMGRPNLGDRFVETVLSVADESQGGNDQEIQFRDLSLRLLLSTDDLQGFEVLPIARIKRAGGEDDTPIRDEDYIPPVLALDTWKPLGIGFVRNIYDFVGQRIEVLSQRAVDRGLTFNSQEPGDLDDLLRLIALNQAYAVLSCLTFAQGVHPFPAYCELVRIVGMLSIFGDTRRTPEIPKYDHDDLARIFKWVELRIKELLGPTEIPYEQRFFEGRDSGMRVQIKSEWLHSGWKWYVGVNGRNISEAQSRDLLKPGKLDWKMGCDSKVDLMFKYAMPGVEHVEIERPPRMLPAHRGWVYYEIRRDSENQAWKGVLAEETLALRFSEELIGNKEELPGKRQLEVVLPDRKAIMEFALFAVPPAQNK